jgi:PAS domain S-box-containing protein
MMKAQDEHSKEIPTYATTQADKLTALEETASHYKAILETTVDAIITIDSQGIVQTFNAAAEKIFGYRAEEVIGNNVKMLMPEPYQSEHDGYISKYLKTGVPKIIGTGRQVNGLRKDGTEFPMDLAVSEVPLKDKRLFAGIIRDMTEHILLEEQLVQSTKLAAVGRLISGIAHEVNNPVSIIKLHIASVMQNIESQKLPEDLIKTLRVIQRQNNKIGQIISGLQAFSRQGSFSPDWINVNQTVHTALRLVENTLQNQGIVYQVELADSLPKVFLDPIRIEQVLLNLFNNAIEAMPDGGVLTISTTLETDQTDEDWVVIRIRDTGTGIEKDHLTQLFDPFFTTKEVGEGTGLGLSVSYGLIQEHGGRIKVSSQPGKGTEFQIYLPITE